MRSRKEVEEGLGYVSQSTAWESDIKTVKVNNLEVLNDNLLTLIEVMLDIRELLLPERR